MTYRSRRGQAPESMVGRNPVEDAFLNTARRLNSSGGIEIERLELMSAMNDLRLAEQLELAWPTKEVLVEKVVEYPDRDGTLKSDTVFRLERVPMTEDEAVEYHRQQLLELVSIADAKNPKAVKKTTKTSKTSKTSKKSKQVKK